MQFNDSEKIALKHMVKVVTKDYISSLKTCVSEIETMVEPNDIEDLMCSCGTENYQYFNTFAQYLLGVEMSSTPRELFWDFDTSVRESLWGSMKNNLPEKLFHKIDKHINSFNRKN